MSSRVEHICEGIDRLITLDLGGRGVIYRLYEAARSKTRGPLVLNAAERILENLKERDFVLITTGFRVLPDKVQETDGPLGAASLLKSLSFSLNTRPIIVTERESLGIVESAIISLGFKKVSNLGELIEKGAFMTIDFPYDSSAAEEAAERLIDEYSPSLLLAVEKAGMGADGKYHTMRGFDVTELHAKVEPLFERARKAGILTVGIGDGGNEVGMGNIREAVEKYVPNGQTIAAVSRVDSLICAAVSNWGGYGLSATIALLTGRKEALHTSSEEEIMLKSIVEAGAIDGITGKRELSVDNIPLKVHSSIIKILEGFLGR